MKPMSTVKSVQNLDEVEQSIFRCVLEAKENFFGYGKTINLERPINTDILSMRLRKYGFSEVFNDMWENKRLVIYELPLCGNFGIRVHMLISESEIRLDCQRAFL